MNYNNDTAWDNNPIENSGILGEISYKNFYVKTNFLYTDKKYEIKDNKLYEYPDYYNMNDISVGYKNVLNNLFYSEDDFKKNSIKIKEKITELTNTKNIITKKEELIDKYIEVKNLELENLLKNTQIEEIEKTLSILKLKLNEKEATAIDFNIMNLEAKKMKEEVSFNNREIYLKKSLLFDLAGINKKELNLKSLDMTDTKEILIGTEEIKALELQIDLEKENLKYLKRQKQWPLEVYGQYELINEDYKVGLSISGDIFELNYEEKQKKYDIENKELELNEELLVYENKINERKNQLDYLKNSEKNYKDLYEVYLEKYNSVKELYLNGDLGLLEYLKTQTEMYKTNVEFLQTRNNYYALLYKISLNLEVE